MRYTDPVLALRRHLIVRVIACVLLTWATADLFVPGLCSSESATQAARQDEDGADHDDCFCCCSHADKTPLTVVLVFDDAPVVVVPAPAPQLAAGVPPGVYHPPLHA